MESLVDFSLGGTAIKELPSCAIHLKLEMSILSFKGCQLSSSSLTSMPRSRNIDLSDCNLSAIPIGIYCNLSVKSLFLRGNGFVSIPESISQFSRLERLYLDGCKSLRSLSNIQIPSTVYFICVDNCTSLERLPEGPEPPNDSVRNNLTIQCFNCFKLAENFQNFSNIFQGQSSQKFEICCIIPGREIPKWFEKVNICDTSVAPVTIFESEHSRELACIEIRKKVKIRLPGSGCDEWRGIVLCVLFLPIEGERYHYIRVKEHQSPQPWLCIPSEYGKVESHHLWLHSLSKNHFSLPKTPGCSIDKKGFHQVELEIVTLGLEVKNIGFRVVLEQNIEDPN